MSAAHGNATRLASGLAVAVIACAAQAAPLLSYTVQDLGLDGYGVGRGINASSQIVGTATAVPGAVDRATVWSNGSLYALSTAGYAGTWGYANNQSGQVAGVSASAAVAVSLRATRWTNGIAELLPGIGAGQSIAEGINDAGLVVGYSWPVNGNNYHATLWSGTVATDLGTLSGAGNSMALDINGSGVVVGLSELIGGTHAVRWDNSGITDLGTLGGTASVAAAVNDDGVIVGYSRTELGGPDHATIWRGSSPEDLGTLGGSNSIARALNQVGQIVGDSQVAGDGETHATMWMDGSVLDLNDHLSTALPSGWYLWFGSGINDSGHVAGTMRNRDTGEQHAFLLTEVEVSGEVPEPAPIALLLIAVFALHRARGATRHSFRGATATHCRSPFAASRAVRR